MTALRRSGWGLKYGLFRPKKSGILSAYERVLDITFLNTMYSGKDVRRLARKAFALSTTGNLVSGAWSAITINKGAFSSSRIFDKFLLSLGVAGTVYRPWDV